MKFNININQYELSKNKEITIQDSAVIDWLFTMCGSDNEKISKKRVEGWTWISLIHLIEDMPLLRIKTSSGASKLVRRIKTLGYIDTKKDTKERKLYVKPTAKLRNLYFSSTPKSKVQMDTAPVLEETSQVLKDLNHNTNNITLETNNISRADVVVKKKTKKQLREEIPYTYENELQLLWDDGWKGNKIIHNYFLRKKFNFENRAQFNAEVGQCKPYANKLLGYTSQQINKTMDYCDTNSKNFVWKLSTVAKTISEVINKNG